jgi:hypothetical protein
MPCKSCSSGNLRNFPTEIAVHLKDIGRHHVFVFPEILVCLKCGFTELVVEEDKLKVVAEDTISGGVKKGNQSAACHRSSQTYSAIVGSEIA